MSEVELESDEDGFQEESDDNAEDPFASDEEVRCSLMSHTVRSLAFAPCSALFITSCYVIVLCHRAVCPSD